jgi:hypothetical protein
VSVWDNLEPRRSIFDRGYEHGSIRQEPGGHTAISGGRRVRVDSAEDLRMIHDIEHKRARERGEHIWTVPHAAAHERIGSPAGHKAPAATKGTRNAASKKGSSSYAGG